MQRLSTIPYARRSLEEAQELQHRFKIQNILVDTRADYTTIEQAAPFDFEDNRWYVVIHTGNLLGMIHDLKKEGFL